MSSACLQGTEGSNSLPPPPSPSPAGRSQKRNSGSWPLCSCKRSPRLSALPTATAQGPEPARAVIADRGDNLDLQVNLLTERHATQIIRMLDHLSTQLGV